MDKLANLGSQLLPKLILYSEPSYPLFIEQSHQKLRQDEAVQTVSLVRFISRRKFVAASSISSLYDHSLWRLE